MAKTFPTYEVTNGFGETKVVRLTKARSKDLAFQSREYGHFAKGHDPVANADVVEVFCPLCSDRVRGYAHSGLNPHSPAHAIDLAVVEHLTEDCRMVTRPEGF